MLLLLQIGICEGLVISAKLCRSPYSSDYIILQCFGRSGV
jgi:hypothetical protein